MKEYYVICYYNSQENRYFTDLNLYPSEEEARKHVKKDVYSMIERREYDNNDLLSQIFNVFCNITNCEKCCYSVNCYDPFYKMEFEAKSEQQKLEICATMARQYDEGTYEQ